MKDLKLLTTQVIEYYKGKKSWYLEDDIFEAVLENGGAIEAVSEVIELLMTEHKFLREIYSREDVDCFGDGSIYRPIENQHPNDMEEWVYIPYYDYDGAITPLTQESIEDLLNTVD